MFLRIGDIIVHTPTPRKATLRELKNYWKLTGGKAKCGKCGEILKPGDFVDHYFPNEIEGNRCQRCHNQEIEEEAEKLTEQIKLLIECHRKEILQKSFEDFFKDEN